MSQDREQRIRDRAYAIWIDTGRPDGCAAAHWAQAAAEIDATAMRDAVTTAPAEVAAEVSAPVTAKPRAPRVRKAAGDAVPAAKPATKRRTTKAPAGGR